MAARMTGRCTRRRRRWRRSGSPSSGWRSASPPALGFRLRSQKSVTQTVPPPPNAPTPPGQQAQLVEVESASPLLSPPSAPGTGPAMSAEDIARVEGDLRAAIGTLWELSVMARGEAAADLPEGWWHGALDQLLGHFTALKAATLPVPVPIGLLDFLDRGDSPEGYVTRLQQESAAAAQEAEAKRTAVQGYRDELHAALLATGLLESPDPLPPTDSTLPPPEPRTSSPPA
eukprot:EG_transcript_22847